MAKKKDVKLSVVMAEALGLARAIRTYWEHELPRVHPDYPFVRPEDPPEKPPREAKQLRAFLKKQPDDIVYQLALIVYLGQVAFDVSDLAGQYEALKEENETPAAAISQMMETAPLADYLEEGIEELKRNRLDLDHLPLRVASGKS
jgi:hypothetical protein